MHVDQQGKKLRQLYKNGYYIIILLYYIRCVNVSSLKNNNIRITNIVEMKSDCLIDKFEYNTEKV